MNEPGWRWEGVEPVPGLHHGRAAVVFRENGQHAVAAINREKKADRWGRVKEKVWWWARPKFKEHGCASVAEAVEAIRQYRPEPIPTELLVRLTGFIS